MSAFTNDVNEDEELIRALELSLHTLTLTRERTEDNDEFIRALEESKREALMTAAPQDDDDDDLRAAMLMSLEYEREKKAEEDRIRLVLEDSKRLHEETKMERDFRLKEYEIIAAAGPLSPGRSRQCIQVPKKSGQFLLGSNLQHAKRIGREAGGKCYIRLLSRPTTESMLHGDCVVIEADNETAVSKAEEALWERCQDLFIQSDQSLTPDVLQRRRQQRIRNVEEFRTVPDGVTLLPEMRRHIFVDNSNVFIGAQNKDRNSTDYTIRINAKELASILECGASSSLTTFASPDSRSLAATRVVAGSKPPANSGIWVHWEDTGFKVKICSRDVDTGAEDLVDDFLHAQALGAVLKRHDDEAGTNTLVLCTGDGNDNKGFTSFLDVAEHTARMGWRVEIWSWSWACSRKFRALSEKIPDRVSVHYLDAYESRVIFRAKGVKRFATTNVTDGSAQREENGSITSATTNDSSTVNVTHGDARRESGSMTSVITNDTSAASATHGNARREDECIICMDNPRNHIILPCGHLTLCQVCATGIILTLCPVCRQEVRKVQQIFY